MSEGTPEITSVTGGSHGTDAAYFSMRLLARDLDLRGNDLRDVGFKSGKVMIDDELLQSSILSPMTFGRVEWEIGEATGGSDGALVVGTAVELDALLVGGSVELYERTDALVSGYHDARDYTIGRMLGTTLPPAITAGALGAAPALAISGVAVISLLAVLPDDIADDIRAGGGKISADLLRRIQHWVTTHPDEVQAIVNGGGGLMDGLIDLLNGPLPTPILHPGVGAAAGTLTWLMDDGDPRILGPEDTPTTQLTDVPHSVEDLLNNLALTNELADGTIEIQTVLGPDGSPRHIVYVPGTDDMNPAGSGGSTLRDMLTNARSISQTETAYQRGIEEAMRRAGLDDGAPIVLVGHSQGGMVSADLAHDSPRGFNITHVITAGSPQAQVPEFGDQTQVLSLENRGDLIPALDGKDNPDQSNRTTVVFDERTDSVGGNHSLDKYARGGAAVDGSSDPSVRDFRDSVDLFLNGTRPGGEFGEQEVSTFTMVRE